jgi:Glycosyl transferase family 2
VPQTRQSVQPVVERASADLTCSGEPVNTCALDLPLVSCILLTRTRRDFGLQAVRYFLRQDYPNRELIVVDTPGRELSRFVPDDPRVYVLRSLETPSNGALMNQACEQAHGRILIHWDDTHWYGVQRISRQVMPIRSGSADATVLVNSVVLDLERWKFYRRGSELLKPARLSVPARTLAFSRHVWRRLAAYPTEASEPAGPFLREVLRRGVRCEAVGASGLAMTVAGSVIQESPLRAVEYRLWPVVEPCLPLADRQFYAGRSPAAPRTPVVPLVSCIMPTRNRRRFAARAIGYFARQDYPSKELVIVDDGCEPIADLASQFSAVRYHRHPRLLVLGTKRNLACELAAGQVIAHLDDDDWYGEHHLSVLVGGLLSAGTDIAGMRRLPFIDVVSGRAWTYEWPKSRRIWAAGNSLAYGKDLWSRSRFPDLAWAEDTAFVWSAHVRSLYDISDFSSIVGVIHPGNTVRKRTAGRYWREMPAGQLKGILLGDLPFYRFGSAALPARR